MGRLVGYVVLGLLTLVGLLWPVVPAVIGPLDDSVPYDPVVITEYKATYDVAANGDLVAVEDITADFPPARHGIFRFWDIADPSDPGVRYVPTLGSITMDGGPVPFETFWDSGRRYYVAKIGDPDRTLRMGLHTYRITYSIAGAISPPSAGTGSFVSSEGTGTPASVFYWNVVAQGWQMRIQQATITVNLPGASTTVQCSAGTRTTASGEGPCQIRGTGSAKVALAASSLPAVSGMTTRIGLATPPPPRSTVLWPVAFDQVLGASVQQVAGIAMISLAGLILGIAWGRSAHERPPGFPVMYAPPAGLGPVQTVYIDTEGVGTHGIVASLLHLAERGVVRLEHRPDDSWLVAGTAPESAWVDIDPVTREVGRRLGVMGEGRWFLADGSTTAGQTLTGAVGSLSTSAAAWADGSGLQAPAQGERWGRLAWLAAIVLAAIGFTTWPLGLTMYGLPFAAFALGGFALMGRGVGTRRTFAGRQVWSQAGGFRRLLSTPSAEDRFDFAARQDLFLAYVPYAVAFDVADRWAAKYRVATGQEPPVPSWYAYGSGYAASRLYSSGGGDFGGFERTLSSSISAYEASQRSSSSGGGGGGSSFGGGGGGGGGGSW